MVFLNWAALWRTNLGQVLASWKLGQPAPLSLGETKGWEMKNADELVGNSQHDNSRYCFAKANEIYLVYLPTGHTTNVDLSRASGQFTVSWFDPRNGGPLKKGSVSIVRSGANVPLGAPPDNAAEGWVIVVRRS